MATFSVAPQIKSVSNFGSTFMKFLLTSKGLSSNGRKNLRWYGIRLVTEDETEYKGKICSDTSQEDTQNMYDKNMVRIYEWGTDKMPGTNNYDIIPGKIYKVSLCYLSANDDITNDDIKWSNEVTLEAKKEAPKITKINALSQYFLSVEFEDTRSEKDEFSNYAWRILDETHNDVIVNTVQLGNKSPFGTKKISILFPESNTTLADKLQLNKKYYFQLGYSHDRSAGTVFAGYSNKTCSTAGAVPIIDYVTNFDVSFATDPTDRNQSVTHIDLKLEVDNNRTSEMFDHYSIRYKIKGTSGSYRNLEWPSQTSEEKNAILKDLRLKREFNAGALQFESDKEYEIQVGYAHSNGETAPEWSKAFVIKPGDYSIGGLSPIITEIPILRQNHLKLKFENPDGFTEHKHKVYGLGIRFKDPVTETIVATHIYRPSSSSGTAIEQVLNKGVFHLWAEETLGKLVKNKQYYVYLSYCIKGQNKDDIAYSNIEERWGVPPWSTPRAKTVIMPEVIYPPYIDTTLPACTRYKIRVPFQHNPAVSLSEVYRFKILFKDLETSELIEEFYTDPASTQDFIKNGEILHTNTSGYQTLKINTFYKVQLAYCAQDQLSSTLKYSYAGVIRCIGGPSVFISRGYQTDYVEASDTSNKTFKTAATANTRLYTGVYDTASPSEPVKEYCFILKQGNDNILDDTGWKTHDSLLDKIYYSTKGKLYRKTSFDYYNLNYELDQTQTYELKYKIRTINGYEHSYTTLIKGTTTLSQQNNEPYRLTIGQDAQAIDNGYMVLQLEVVKNFKTNNEENRVKTQQEWQDIIKSSTSWTTENKKRLFGSFVLRRTDEKSNFTLWENIRTINFTKPENYNSTNPAHYPSWDKLVWLDTSIEHGVQYQYAISRLDVNNAPLSWYESNKYTAYFEHMYLTDGEKQLCLRFNPQVSTYKTIVQESKVDTIGGKYPFFFKNGDIKYQEIAISGLISYLIDEHSLFFNYPADPTTNLTYKNIAIERYFKNEVLNWLNNGKPKYFRSPTEGNFIVRTLNSSLSPNATVGRMLHTVSTTGYEAADNTITEMINNNVLYIPKVKSEWQRGRLK